MEHLGPEELLAALWEKHARQARGILLQEIGKARVRFAAGNVDVNSGSPLLVQWGLQWSHLEALVRTTLKDFESRLEGTQQTADFFSEKAKSVLSRLVAQEIARLGPVGPMKEEEHREWGNHKQRLLLHLESIASVELQVLAATPKLRGPQQRSREDKVDVPNSLGARRSEILTECAKRFSRRPPEDWATWESMGNHAAHAVLDLAAHALQDEGLVEARFLPGRAGFAARITARGIEHLKAQRETGSWSANAKVAGTNQSTDGRSERRQDVDARRVFVVHGRDALAQKAMFDLLRALGLRPIEWEDARSQTGSASPHNSEIIDAGMASAKAVVVLFTPDELVRLRADLQREPGDDLPGWQPRPNVVFEAGAAFQLYPRATVVVEVGNMRPVSDLAGRNTVRVAVGPEWRQRLKQRLQDSGCAVDAPGTDWLTAGDFDSVLAAAQRATTASIEPPAEATRQTGQVITYTNAELRAKFAEYLRWWASRLTWGMKSELDLKLWKAAAEHPWSALSIEEMLDEVWNMYEHGELDVEQKAGAILRIGQPLMRGGPVRKRPT